MIKERDAKDLDQIITVIFHSETIQEATQRVREIHEELRERRNASLVAIAIAGSLLGATQTLSETSETSDIETRQHGGFTPKETAGLVVASTLGGAAIAAELVGGGVLLATSAVVVPVAIGALAGATLAFLAVLAVEAITRSPGGEDLSHALGLGVIDNYVRGNAVSAWHPA